MTTLSGERDRYLTAEYERKLLTITPSGVDTTEIQRIFLEDCEELHRFLHEETPIEVVRRVAFRRTERTMKRVGSDGGVTGD